MRKTDKRQNPTASQIRLHPYRRPAHTKPKEGRWGVVIATKAGASTPIGLNYSQNSFGEPDIFAGKRPGAGKKEFEPLRGYPLYAIQQWLVSNGYTYEVR